MEIVHIHTDLKFVDDSFRFENESFSNIIVIFGEKEMYNGRYKDKALFYSNNLVDIKKIINICKKSDIVVLYDLNFIKCYIANLIPNNVIIIWRFFGLELYSKMPNYVYSELTLSIKEKKLPVVIKAINLLKSIFVQIKYRTNKYNQFEKGIKRVNYFAGLSEIEYAFLKKKFPKIPPFLQLSLSEYFRNNMLSIHKRNNIILGNNRSAYNNHLDILYLIKNSKMKSDYNFFLMFNYGQNNEYTSSVRNLASQISNVNIIEDFLTIHEFKKFYSDISAFVLNGHRQMAMGNIFEALINHVKIYLNEKNVILDWLRKEGFLVYTIDDFKSDLEKNNIKLNESEILHNKKQLVIFTQKYCKNDFQNKILDIIAKTNK